MNRNRRSALLLAAGVMVAHRGSAMPAARERLVGKGEAALARGDLDAAEQAFEAASVLAHEPDAELGLIRTAMQRGRYGRALALAAHTAGDHREEAQGAAMYAWLLHMGSQYAPALRVLDEAASQVDGVTPLLDAVRQQLQSVNPIASGELMQLPARLAPYTELGKLPPHTRPIANATLIDGGRQALAPLRLANAYNRKAWVRDGMGRVSAVRLEQALPALGIAILRLDRPLGWAGELLGRSDVFPGSIAHAARYAVRSDSDPGWPLLATGFVGSPRLSGAERWLGWLDSGQDGGPVLDAAGRLAGVTALRESNAPLALIQLSQIHAANGQPLIPVRPTEPRLQVSSESIYETVLQIALQVLI